MQTKGFTIWLTGLSASGKTTVSKMLEKMLRDLGVEKIELLDGDIIRENFSKGLTFSEEDRNINVLRVGFVCHLLTRNDVVAIAALISPYRSARHKNRVLIGNYVEVFVDTPIEVCEQRDPKGLYKRARAGEIPNFTGISDPFEAPQAPDVRLDTVKYSPEECAAQIIEKLVDQGYIQQSPEAGDDSAEVYSEEEEATVRKRLEDLGYI